MKNEMETRTENTITLNNVDAVIERLKSQESDYEESFLTMVQGNTFGGVVPPSTDTTFTTIC